MYCAVGYPGRVRGRVHAHALGTRAHVRVGSVGSTVAGTVAGTTIAGIDVAVTDVAGTAVAGVLLENSAADL